MKRKRSVGLIVVMALLLGSTALAAGLGLNLFSYFGRNNANWADLADQAVLEAETPAIVTHEVLGEAEAVITNAYYDGRQLAVAFAIQQGRKIEWWTPSEEEKAGLTRFAGTPPYEVITTAYAGEAQAAFRDEIAAKAEAGEPVGFTIRIVYPGQMTSGGVMLLTGLGDWEIQADGAYYEIRECLVPLRGEVRDQDALTLRMPLIQTTGFYWFDGSDWYSRYEAPQEVSVMTATVQRSGSDRRSERYEGATSTEDGASVGVEVCISDGMMEILMTADAPGFPYHYEIERFDGGESWSVVKTWDIIGLYDERGRELHGAPTGGCYFDDAREHFLGYRCLCEWSGELPGSIRLELEGWGGEGETVSVLLQPVK